MKFSRVCLWCALWGVATVSHSQQSSPPGEAASAGKEGQKAASEKPALVETFVQADKHSQNPLPPPPEEQDRGLSLLPSGEPPRSALDDLPQSPASTFRPGEAPNIHRQKVKGEEKLILVPEEFFKGEDWLPWGNVTPWGSTQPDKRKGPHTLPASGLVESLYDALAYAYMRNPTLSNARVEVSRAVEALSQANAENRPFVSLEGRGALSRDWDRTNTQPLPLRNGGGSWEEGPTHTTSGKLSVNLEQNIFNGGGTLARIRKAEQSIKAYLASLVQQEQETFKDVIEAYVNVILYQVVLTKERLLERLSNELLGETDVKYTLGDKPLSELALAQSRLAGATTRVRTAEANLAGARGKLVSLCGANLAKNLTLPEPYGQAPSTLQDLESVALRYYPAVLKAKFQEFVARQAVEETTAKFLPKVDFTASAGPTYSDAFSYRTQSVVGGDPTSQKSATDRNQFGASAAITMSVPLYSRGANSSFFRDAQNALKEARLSLEQARRTTYSLCATYFSAFQASKENVTACRLWVEHAGVSLQAIKLRNALGEEGLLGVVQVQNEFSDAYQNYIETMGRLIQNSYYLLSMEGKLTAKDLGLDVQHYDAFQYYNKHKDAWFTLGRDQEKDPLFIHAPERQPAVASGGQRTKV